MTQAAAINGAGLPRAGRSWEVSSGREFILWPHQLLFKNLAHSAHHPGRTAV